MWRIGNGDVIVTREQGGEEEGGEGDEQGNGGSWEALTTTFALRPTHIHAGKLEVIKTLQSFHEDPSQKSMTLSCSHPQHEAFIHQIAASLMLGRESVWDKAGRDIGGKGLSSASSKSRSRGLGGDMWRDGSRGVLVRIWKPVLYMCSTIRKAEACAIGPLLPQDNRPWEECDDSSIINKDEEETEGGASDTNKATRKSSFTIVWQVRYKMNSWGRLSISCSVDASNAPTLLPRVGLQFCLRGGKERDSNTSILGRREGTDRLGSASLGDDSITDRRIIAARIKAAEVAASKKKRLAEIAAERKREWESGLWLGNDWVGDKNDEEEEEEFSVECVWMGNGPHENYSDRCASSINAVHRAPAHTLQVPYIRPSENGARGGVKWLQLSVPPPPPPPSSPVTLPPDTPPYDPIFGGPGIKPPPPTTAGEDDEKNTRHVRISSTSPFSFSLQPHTTEDLATITHSTSLSHSQRPFLCLNLDPFLMGLGGDDSWTACVHEQYTLPPDKYDFSFVFDFYGC